MNRHGFSQMTAARAIAAYGGPVRTTRILTPELVHERLTLLDAQDEYRERVLRALHARYPNCRRNATRTR